MGIIEVSALNEKGNLTLKEIYERMQSIFFAPILRTANISIRKDDTNDNFKLFFESPHKVQKKKFNQMKFFLFDNNGIEENKDYKIKWG